MVTQSDEIKVLERLGLTQVQSQVFIANFRIGKATAKQISIDAKIAREDVYRVMPSLQKLGLVKKHITSPTVFETIDIEEAVRLLMQNRKSETKEIGQAVQNLIKTTKQNKEVKPWINFDEELVLLSNNNVIDLTITKELQNLKQNLEITVNWECHRFKGDVWAKTMLRLLEKGVKIRVVMNLPNQNNFCLPKSTIELMQHTEFKVKYLKEVPECVISIYDNSRGFIFSSNCENNLNPPVLWTSNPTIISLMKCFFETVWRSSLEMSYEEIVINLL